MNNSEYAETNSDYLDIQLVQNVQELPRKTPQEGREGLEFDENDRQGGVTRASGTVLVLPPSRVGQLITHGLKKLRATRNPRWHQACKGVVLRAGDCYTKQWESTETQRDST